MSAVTELLVGKIYHLKFHDDGAEVEDCIQGLKSLSCEYKLIGVGMIPWGSDKSEKYEYCLFKNYPLNKMIEVCKQDGVYMSLVFYGCSGLTTGSYSDYLDYGQIDFPEFCGNSDVLVNVDISEAFATP